MVIDERAKKLHFKWLRGKVCSRSKGSFVNSKISDGALHFSLEFSPKYANHKPLVPEFTFKDSRFSPFPILWMFKEIWSVAGAGNKYEFCGFFLRMMDHSESEILSIHWNFPCPDRQRYQPHWHFPFVTEGYYLRHLHVPLNQEWGSYYPPDLNSYHKWLDGLFVFLDSEFPRCLRKKRSLPTPQP